MGGEGSMAAMQSSLNNNRSFLKKNNRFRRKAKGLITHHIESYDAKHLTEEEHKQFLTKLNKTRIYNRIVSVVVFSVMLIILVLLILLLT